MKQWISVKDQAIPENKKVLVYGNRYGGTDTFMSIADTWSLVRKDDGKIFHYVDVPEVSGYEREVEFDYVHITHWMELPDPPSA